MQSLNSYAILKGLSNEIFDLQIVHQLTKGLNIFPIGLDFAKIIRIFRT